MIPPTKQNFTVYTKMNCKYCAKVKELLEHETVTYIPSDEFLTLDKEAFLAFIETNGGKGHKTFPMVFYDGTFIGGFTETFAFMKEKYV
jgi:glutaredoxin